MLFDTHENGAKSMISYMDSDYKGDLDMKKSTSGYTFILAIGYVSWRSMKQICISQSSTEVEYMIATEAIKEVI